MISKYFEFSAEFPRSQDIIKEHKFQKYFCHSIFIHTLVLPINKQYYMRKKYCESMKIISILDFIEALYFHCFFLFCSIKKSSRREKNQKYSKLVNSSSEEDQHVTSTKAYTFFMKINTIFVFLVVILLGCCKLEMPTEFGEVW